MRAALHHRFGGPEVLEIAEIGDPKPGPGEVLLAVRATRSTVSTSCSAADRRCYPTSVCRTLPGWTSSAR